MLVLAAPEQGPFLAEALCVYFNYSTTCYNEYSRLALGSVFSQVAALGDMGGYDGQVCLSDITFPCLSLRLLSGPIVATVRSAA